MFVNKIIDQYFFLLKYYDLYNLYQKCYSEPLVTYSMETWMNV